MNELKLVPVTQAAQRDPRWGKCVGKFDVVYGENRLCQAYLYENGRWWLIAPSNKRMFIGRSGGRVWNLELYAHEAIGAVLEEVLDYLHLEPDHDAEATAAYVNQDR